MVKKRPAKSAADIYDEMFVPALFQQWGDTVADVAGINDGQQVLDVACGTGVAAMAAEDGGGTNGKVTGLDINEEMLGVARRKNERIDRRHNLRQIDTANVHPDRSSQRYHFNAGAMR